MKCFNCIHLDLLEYPKHARTGYGRCVLDKEWEIAVKNADGVNLVNLVDFTTERKCKDFEQAKDASIRAREVFINGGT